MRTNTITNISAQSVLIRGLNNSHIHVGAQHTVEVPFEFARRKGDILVKTQNTKSDLVKTGNHFSTIKIKGAITLAKTRNNIFWIPA